MGAQVGVTAASAASAAPGSAAVPDSTAWALRLAKVRLLHVSKGTGWAIGRSGVLTARHVVAALLGDGAAVSGGPPEAEVVLGAAPERSFEFEIVWDDAALDLAILSIGARGRVTWQTLLRRSEEHLLAYPAADPVPDVTVVGLAGRATDGRGGSSLSWMLAAPEDARGTLVPDPDGGHHIVETDRSELSRAAWRHGMSGAVVLRQGPQPMVLGIVIGKLRGRRSTRFEVSTLPDPASNDALRQALEAVGAAPVVFNMDGPELREFVTDDCLDAAWRPIAVPDIPDAGWFGTRLARTDVARPEVPYGTFVMRPERTALADALDRAIAGAGPRIIVVRGPSAAGKSRLVAEVLPTHPGLADHVVLRPKPSRSILDLPERLHPGAALIWMDNLQDYPANALSHERLRVMLEDHLQTVVVGTVLDPPERTGSARLVDSGQNARSDEDLGAGFPLASASLSGVFTTIDDAGLTTTIALPATPRWIRPRTESDPATWALARATKQGLGLGEYLSGYHELVDHYTAAGWATRTLVDLVADWDRSGIGEPLGAETARLLWDRLMPAQLPRDELRLFLRMTPAEIERQWRGSLAYACHTVVGTGALLRMTPSGLVSSEFARIHIDRGAIGGQIWDYLLHEHPTTPVQRISLGLRALGSGTPQRALRAFESILFFRDDDLARADNMRLLEVVARRGIALYHTRTGRDEQAIMVYTDLVDTFGTETDADICEQLAQALLGIGLTFSKLGSHGQAVSAYTELVDRYRDHPSPILAEYVAKALLGQASTLAELGRHDEERAAYADIVARYGDDAAPAVQAIVEVARAALDS
jgi:tetratricopeptide (TPR) repeat protein